MNSIRHVTCTRAIRDLRNKENEILKAEISTMTFRPRMPIVQIHPVAQGFERFLRRKPWSADEEASSTISARPQKIGRIAAKPIRGGFHHQYAGFRF